MAEWLISVLSWTFLMQVVRVTIPYALAAMGGVVSERSGVVNIALEGILLMGAFGAAVGAYDSGGSVPIAMLYGIGAGVATAALYALAVVTLKADQIVSGVAINMLAYAITPYFLKAFYNSSSNSPEYQGFGGKLLGNPVLWLALILVVAVQAVVTRTRWGLRVRAVGDNPHAAHTLGVSVNTLRWQAVLASGALAGLGGSWLALSGSSFVAGMSAGRGYIALAAVIMGSWRPIWACAASLLFGFAEAMVFNLQSFVRSIPNELIQIFPYVLTMITLAGFIGRSRPPADLGRPFSSR
jgi:general nucleoside transport system permease protein